ncbi:hypothetical protein AWN76_002615 [Rhodothermaceae bacterium RA]|nr:hypothetical protein AWN76_002615 [Rhodothermaceae bacterium RA]
MHAQYAPATQNLTSLTLTGGGYGATIELSATDVEVIGSGEVVFRSGGTIRLESGFRVEAGAAFKAEIIPGFQTSIGVLPGNTPDPSLGDYTDRPRPRLSLIGFDSGNSSGDSFTLDPDQGRGVKQVLDAVFVDAAPSYASDLYVTIVYNVPRKLDSGIR